MVMAEVIPEHVYTPLGAARELLLAKDNEVLIEGPAGTGKSRAVWQKGDLLCREIPGLRALAVRKTRVSMSETVMPIYERFVNRAAGAEGVNRGHRQSYRYANGSVIVLGGMDNADRIMSSEYDFIMEFEATELTEDDHEKLGTRLRSPVWRFKQQVAECNPGAPTHWLNQRCNAGRMKRLLSRHEDNPACTEEYIRTRLDTLTGVRFLRLRKGIWAAAEGVVYDGFDAAVHVIDAMPAGWESWDKYRSIDFGFTNPFVCQWWAVDPDGRMYLYREIYKTQRTVRDHAEEIKRLSQGENIRETVTDHDAEDRATLRQEGIESVGAKKDIRPGLDSVGLRLRVSGDGRPRLFVCRSALAVRDDSLAERKAPLCTADEFDCYMWRKGRDGAPVKEEPEKVNDHGMDAMRYMVMHLDSRASYGFEYAHKRAEPLPSQVQVTVQSPKAVSRIAERNRRWDAGL